MTNRIATLSARRSLAALGALFVAAPAVAQDNGYRPQGFGYENAYQQDGYQEHFALVCYGEGHRLASQPNTGYQWNSDRRAMNLATATPWVARITIRQ